MTMRGREVSRPFPQPQPVTIFVINLDEDVDRLEAMRVQLEGLGLSFTRYPAHRGTQLSGWLREQFFDARGIPHSSMNEGQIGCYASHLAVSRTILEEGIAGPILVLEDDVAFAPEFIDVLSNLGKLPEDWEIVRCTNPPKSAFVTVSHLTPQTEVVRYWRIPMGATAYFINRKGAERFVHGRAKRTRPVDSDLRRFWEFGLQTYGLLPVPIRWFSNESSIKRVATQSTMDRRPKVRDPGARMSVLRARLQIFGPWLSLKCVWADLRAVVLGISGVKRKYSPSLRIAPSRPARPFKSRLPDA